MKIARIIIFYTHIKLHFFMGGWFLCNIVMSFLVKVVYLNKNITIICIVDAAGLSVKSILNSYKISVTIG